MESETQPFEGSAPWSCIAQPADGARDKLLSAATELFCQNGFAATGVDTIVQHAATAKSTLYAHFKSKENLIDAVLAREGKAWRDWFFARLKTIPGTPAVKLAAVFDVLQEWFQDPRFYGCPFINAISEASSDNDRLRAAAAEHKSHVNVWIKAQALELGHPDPDQFVREMTILIDGAIVAAQISRNSDFAQTAKSMIVTRLRNLGSIPLASTTDQFSVSH
ncbi:MAG: TetR/AcrR family transcriptional regulator [Pseudomonadota bacterium]